MLESRDVTVRVHIQKHEGDSFIHLVNFMSNDVLEVMEMPDVLGVLAMANQFNVQSCMSYCVESLLNRLMEHEHVVVYLNIPVDLLNSPPFLALHKAAKNYVCEAYNNISRFKDQVLQLPLAGIIAILESKTLQVVSEDYVCDFAMEWYKKQEVHTSVDTMTALREDLCSVIRFPFLSSTKITEFMACFGHEFSQTVLVEALIFKGEPLHRQRAIAAENPRFLERAYVHRPVTR